MVSTFVGIFPETTTDSDRSELHLIDDEHVLDAQLLDRQLQHRLEEVPLLSIGLLSQIRQTYDEIEAFANELALNGEINPVQVRICGVQDALDHLKIVNQLHGSAHTLFKLEQLEGGHYAILISGHRRTKAKLHLWLHGCEVCKEAYGEEAIGSCYARHFPLRSGRPYVEVSTYEYISTRAAMSMQCRENIHRAVPAFEQASHYDQWFVLERCWNPDLSAAAFARSIGANVDTVRRAQRYCRLPVSLRNKVEAGQLGYGMALAIGYVADALNFSQEEIEAEVERVILGSLTRHVYERSMRDTVARARAGEASLFGLGGLAALERPERRGVFDRKTVHALHAFSAYFRQVLPLLQGGEMGRPGRIYWDTSTRTLLRDNVDILQTILVELSQPGEALDLDGVTTILKEASWLVS